MMSPQNPMFDVNAPQTQFGKLSKASFSSSGILAHPHVQTIFPKFLLRTPPPKSVNERVQTPDGDFVDLAWFMPNSHKSPKALVVMFHGLEGSVNSHYIRYMASALEAENVGAVLMHFRGCSGEPNLTQRAYHSGATFDPLHVVPILAKRYPTVPLIALGFSLGGNMLMKLMAEHPELPIEASISVSAPLNLSASSSAIDVGFSKVYQWYLMKSMKANLLKKMDSVDMSALSVSKDEIAGMRSFAQFDDNITAVLHGFGGAQDYYTQCSALKDLPRITKPTLILHAKDDPFMDERVIPSADLINQNVAYELSDVGGHVGFVQSLTGQSKFWLPNRILAFINEILA